MLKVPARFADRLDRGMRRIVLGDLGPYGLPPPREGTFARLERLGFVPVPGQIRRMSADAGRIARDIARQAGDARHPQPRRALSAG